MPFISSFGDSFAFARRPSTVYVPAAPSPTTIAVWYDAADPAVFNPNSSNGTAITQWNDKSNLAHNAAPQGGSNVRPVVFTNIQNGNTILRFNGTNNNLQAGNTTWAQSLPAITILVVARASTLTGTRTITSTDQNGFKIFFDGTAWGVSTSGGTGMSSITGDTTKFHIFSLVFDGTQTTNASRLAFRYDRAPQTLSFTGTVGTTTSAIGTKFNVGWYSTTSSEYFGGDVAEILLYTRALSTNELTTEENYLAYHWGL